MAGNDTLNGGGGNDTLDGGTGRHVRGVELRRRYLFVHASDVVTEDASAGADTVKTSLATYTLTANSKPSSIQGPARSPARESRQHITSGATTATWMAATATTRSTARSWRIRDRRRQRHLHRRQRRRRRDGRRQRGTDTVPRRPWRPIRSAPTSRIWHVHGTGAFTGTGNGGKQHHHRRSWRRHTSWQSRCGYVDRRSRQRTSSTTLATSSLKRSTLAPTPSRPRPIPMRSVPISRT